MVSRVKVPKNEHARQLLYYQHEQLVELRSIRQLLFKIKGWLQIAAIVFAIFFVLPAIAVMIFGVLLAGA